MVDATIARAARRQVDREGESIDLKTKTKTGESEYGEEYNESTQTVKAIVPTPSKGRDADFFGVADTDLDIEFIMDSTIDVPDGGGRGASEVDQDQDGTFEYVVLTAVDTQGGLQRVACSDIDFDG